MGIAAICQRQVITIDAVATLREAAILMREQHVGALVVTVASGGQDQVVGVLTDRDLAIEALARGLVASEVRVVQVASRQLVAVAETADLAEAVDAMQQAGVRRLLVTGAQGELTGFVTADDVVDALAAQLTGLAAAMQLGITRESSERAQFAPPRPRPAFLPQGTPGMQEPVGT